jgi:hypothetical protein
MTRIAISLDDERAGQLARIAQQAKLSEEDLVRSAVEQLLQAERAPRVPRYARRLGPLAARGR